MVTPSVSGKWKICRVILEAQTGDLFPRIGCSIKGWMGCRWCWCVKKRGVCATKDCTIYCDAWDCLNGKLVTTVALPVIDVTLAGEGGLFPFVL